MNESNTPTLQEYLDLMRKRDELSAEVTELDIERVDYWLKNGAKPSTTVASLIRRAKNPNLKPHHAVKAQPKPAEAAPAAEGASKA